MTEGEKEDYVTEVNQALKYSSEKRKKQKKTAVFHPVPNTKDMEARTAVSTHSCFHCEEGWSQQLLSAACQSNHCLYLPQGPWMGTHILLPISNHGKKFSGILTMPDLHTARLAEYHMALVS